MPGLKIYINTIRYLRLIQVFYRLFYALRDRFRRVLTIQGNFNRKVTTRSLGFIPSVPVKNSLQQKTFSFLNQPHEFTEDIDWDESRYGQLWTFNLNYFEFLMQDDLDNSMKIRLMKEFISRWSVLKTARHPYTISLRGINWIKFLAGMAGEEPEIESHLYGQYHCLSRNPEYNLLGNHLLKNGFSLLFAAGYFGDRGFLHKAKKIIRQQLEEQILRDGAHFELSPLYHRIILVHLLDSINLLKNNECGTNEEFHSFLEKQAQKMLGWMNQMTLANGELPHFNDSTAGVAPSPDEINEFAERLGIVRQEGLPLTDSGFRVFKRGFYELVCDMGNIGPDYQPAHAHSDTFSFELYIGTEAVISDTGISTYEAGEIRDYERSTRAHNTVEVNGIDQSETWAAFRVARRAHVLRTEETEDFIAATHNGYRRIGLLHRRSFRVAEKNITIRDELKGKKEHSARFYLHFAPAIQVRIEKQVLKGKNFEIHFSGKFTIDLENYKLAEGFNRRANATVAVITFKKYLESEIKIIP